MSYDARELVECDITDNDCEYVVLNGSRLRIEFKTDIGIALITHGGGEIHLSWGAFEELRPKCLKPAGPLVIVKKYSGKQQFFKRDGARWIPIPGRIRVDEPFEVEFRQ